MSESRITITIEEMSAEELADREVGNTVGEWAIKAWIEMDGRKFGGVYGGGPNPDPSYTRDHAIADAMNDARDRFMKERLNVPMSFTADVKGDE
jgi:hypothetical protein